MVALPELSTSESRIIAVMASQLPRRASHVGTVDQVLNHLGAVQLDAINVLGRAHQLTIAARLDGTNAAAVDQQLWGSDEAVAFEYPAHAAALVSISDWPLWAFCRRANRGRPEYPDASTRRRILQRVASEGPIRLSELREPNESGSGWSWSPTKTAVQFLTWTGELICTHRDERDQRLFDLPQNRVPASLLTDDIDDPTCLRRLLERAGGALGVATAEDLADYLRIHPATAQALLPETDLTQVAVQGWRRPAWLTPTFELASNADDAGGAEFVGPFDNLIWYRKRVARIFGFEHVLEAYKPANRRVHGYYVCPLRLKSNLIGRADLVRKDDALVVVRASLDVTEPRAVDAFVSACGRLARQIGVENVRLQPDALTPRLNGLVGRALG